VANWGQFGEFDEVREADKPAACQVCEAMLPDAVDGALSEAEQRAFERHVAGCVVCARELEEAKRGAAWLGMLKGQAPEPSALLLERIIAQTTGAQSTGAQGALAAGALVAAAPAWTSLSVRAAAAKPSVWQSLTGAFSLDWMRPLLQPRMAMTAAMAFFSVALTLNLTGVRLSTVSAASLRPATLRRTVAERGAAAVRGFQNMRVVYQTEAQVDDLRSTWQAEGEQPQRSSPDQSAPASPDSTNTVGAAKPAQPADKQAPPDKPQGSSQLDFAPVGLQSAGMTRKGV